MQRNNFLLFSFSHIHIFCYLHVCVSRCGVFVNEQIKQSISKLTVVQICNYVINVSGKSTLLVP